MHSLGWLVARIVALGGVVGLAGCGSGDSYEAGETPLDGTWRLGATDTAGCAGGVTRFLTFTIEGGPAHGVRAEDYWYVDLGFAESATWTMGDQQGTLLPRLPLTSSEYVAFYRSTPDAGQVAEWQHVVYRGGALIGPLWDMTGYEVPVMSTFMGDRCTFAARATRQ